MLRQIRLLFKIQTCNLMGFNEYRHTKDASKKRRFLAMAAVWAVLSVILVVYVGLLSGGLIALGLSEVVPVYLFTVTSLVILFFSFFKAGSVIFQMNTYEMLISLPVSKTAIVVSRFFSMYITNLLLSLAVLLPGMALYAIRLRPGLGFYAFSLLGAVFLPLLPMTLATIAGAFITAISSRMRNKSLVYSGLSVLLAVGAIALSTGSAGGLNEITEDMLKNLASVISTQMGSLYPPAIWFGQSVIHGSLPSFLLLLGVSAAVFLAMALAVGRFFTPICSALNATHAKNNYKLGGLAATPPLAAMLRRELKRYFASSVYVTNTIIGYFMMAAASVALFIMGPASLEASLGYPGLISKAFPLFLGAIGAITTPASCSISMEGKQWWISKTLPVRSKDIFDSKILLALTVALPEYLVAVVFGLLALKPALADAVWVVLIPAAYIVYSAVAGVTVNVRMPVFNWESEIRAVKQSASVMVTMLINFAGVVIPIALLLNSGGASSRTVMLVSFLAISAVTAGMYALTCKKRIVSIG